MVSISQPLVRLGTAYFFLQLQFWFPIWIIFLLDRGFTLTQIVIADIVYNGAVVLFEVPAGIFGDKIGRKFTYILGAVMACITYGLMIIITDFSLLLLSWLSWSIFVSIISGTDTAYIFELYRQTTGKSDSGSIYGKFAAIAAFASLLSHFLAGILYTIDLRLPIFLNAIFALFAIPFISSLPSIQPTIQQQETTVSFRTLVADLRSTSLPVWLLILGLGIMNMYNWTTTLLLQPFLSDVGVSIANFGVIYGISTGLAIIVGVITGTIIKRFGNLSIVIFGLLAFLGLVGIIGIAEPVIGVVALIGLRPLFTLVDSPVKAIVNKEFDDHKRASLFSFANLFSSLLLMISRPVVGFATVKWDARTAFLVWFFLGLVVIPIIIMLLRTGQRRLEAAQLSQIDPKIQDLAAGTSEVKP